MGQFMLSICIAGSALAQFTFEADDPEDATKAWIPHYKHPDLKPDEEFYRAPSPKPKYVPDAICAFDLYDSDHILLETVIITEVMA